MIVKKWIGWILKVIGIAILLLIAIGIFQSLRPVRLQNLSMMTLNGEAVSENDFTGKRTILNFWATWCKPCIAEMPMLDSVYQQLDTSRWQMFLVSEESSEKIEAFRDKNAFAMPFMRSTTKLSALAISALPKTVIVDENMTVLYTKTGCLTMTASEFVEMIKQRKWRK